jgi:uncharacterized phage protein (predicted DNA packaging)
MYISIEDIKQHLNVDLAFQDDDKYLGQLIEVAQQVVERNIDRPLSDFEDNDGDLPESLLQAMKLFVANMYANRESISFANAKEVPLSYQYLIDLYRDYKGPRNKKCKHVKIEGGN